MKTIILIPVLLFVFLKSNVADSQELEIRDTIISMGDHNINFSIMEGVGTPILFEAGASNDGTVWRPILKELHEITGATLIAYDRAGFGKSSVDTVNTDLADHGVMAGIRDLENGLSLLGFDDDIVLVSHSYGGYFSYLYSSRNPEKVKAIVAIDIVHDYHAEGFAEKLVARMEGQISQWETSNKGMYYLLATLTEAAAIIVDLEIPSEIPVFDIVMSSRFGINEEEANRWVYCHEKFVKSHPKAIGIYAENTEHYVWNHNPSLIINTIVKAYTENANGHSPSEIYKRALDYSIAASNLNRKNMYAEEKINSWGYMILEKGEVQKAMSIFKLNTELYPHSFNVFDSYGEALLEAGMVEDAIEMYRKSLELNSENENARKIVEKFAAAQQNKKRP